MYFDEFRKIVQEYCKMYEIPLLSKREYKELHYLYNKSLTTAPVPDSDITVGQFLSVELKVKEVKPTEAIQFLSLAHCSKAEPTYFDMPVCTDASVRCQIKAYDCCNKEGTNPMYNDKKTEIEVSRAYLLGRLNEATYAKRDQLRKLFNLDAITMPKTYKELIDAIKNDKYTLDTKMIARIDICVEDEGCYYGSPFEGINFTGFPKPDYTGHADAIVAHSKEVTKVKDSIYGPSYEVAQKALNDFEAWVPTPATT